MTGQSTPPNNLPKRFYDEVIVSAQFDGHAILLDGRSIRTPGKRALVVPTVPLAQAIADEWSAQSDVINPATMPITRLANTTLDAVQLSLHDVGRDIVQYAASDLLCYREADDRKLAHRQAGLWDPILRSLESSLNVSFNTTAGIMHISQPDETLAAITAWTETKDAFQLAALHVMTTISGSALLAIALGEGHITSAEAWQAAQLDETYQNEKWGEDQEAGQNRERRRKELESAALYYSLVTAD